MKLSLVAFFALVAAAEALTQVSIRTDTAEELAGKLTAEDGTVLHFASTADKLVLHDADMNLIYDTDVLGGYHDSHDSLASSLLQMSESADARAEAMFTKVSNIVNARNARSFSDGLGQIYAGNENALAMRFHSAMLGMEKHRVEQMGADEFALFQEASTSSSKYGSFEATMATKGKPNCDGVGLRNIACPRAEAKYGGRNAETGRCGPQGSCYRFVCGSCGCHEGCNVHDRKCCDGTLAKWRCGATATLVMWNCDCCSACAGLVEEAAHEAREGGVRGETKLVSQLKSRSVSSALLETMEEDMAEDGEEEEDSISGRRRRRRRWSRRRRAAAPPCNEGL